MTIAAPRRALHSVSLDPSPGTELPAGESRQPEAEMAVGPDLRVRTWSEAAARMTGVRVAQVVGRRLDEVMSEVVSEAGSGGIVFVFRPLPARSGRHLAVAERAPAGPSQAPQTRIMRIDLTERQLEVLELLGEGLAAWAIAVRLWVCETTIRNHIRTILLELGVHSELAAVVKAARLGLIPPVGPSAS